MAHEPSIDSAKELRPNTPDSSLQDDGLVGVGSDAFVNVVRKEVPRGGLCEVKKLFQGPPKCECCINWVETPPAGSNNELTNAKWGEFAVVVRKSSHGGDSTWKLHSIMIHSPAILDLLRKHLKNYPGLSMNADEVQFKAPFAPLLHHWDKIVEGIEAETNESARKHLDLFREIMSPELAPGIKAAEECRKHLKIQFNDLWTIFKPGTLVYFEEGGQPNLGHLTNWASAANLQDGATFTLHVDRVDFDGVGFGFRRDTLEIEEYSGFKSIFENPMPFEMKSDSEAIREQLIERGRHFEMLKGYQFKAYNGQSEDTDMWGKTTRQRVTGRVIIDATMYYTHDLAGSINLAPLDKEHTGPPAVIPIQGDHGQHHPTGDSRGPPPPNYPVPPHHFNPNNRPPPPPVPIWGPPRRGPPVPVRTPRHLKESSQLEEILPLTDDQLMLCVSYVHGFHLSSKKWRKLFVNEISDIVWDNPFDNLVLPDNVKDLLLAFVRTKTSGDATFDDFVGGKGKGMIMLLSGAPGVGKTLTAEAIAEKLKVPVYTLSAGELGIDAEDVENKLLGAMKRCARWNAVLLLDECDIFLEKRELNSLERNELVSIFLRLVEYYEGIMLLTTNRINCIDPAFESRVDVAISYDNLSASARRQIWVNFITKMEQDGARIDKGLGDAALGKLAEHVLNGRQIKSIVKTGYLLARSKDQALNVSHLDAVLDLHSKRARQYE